MQTTVDCTQAMFTRIRFHCESVLIHARLILTFTFSHLNEYPKRTDLKVECCTFDISPSL